MRNAAVPGVKRSAVNVFPSILFLALNVLFQLQVALQNAFSHAVIVTILVITEQLHSAFKNKNNYFNIPFFPYFFSEIFTVIFISSHSIREYTATWAGLPVVSHV